jgi:hypothetical protein
MRHLLRIARTDNTMKCLIFGVTAGILLFELSAVMAQSKVRHLPVAQIVKEGHKLDKAIVEIRGDIRLSNELSSIGDSSKCEKPNEQPCKLSFAIDNCKVSGKKYSNVECSEAVDALRKQFGFPRAEHQYVVIKGVVVVGILSTERGDLTSNPRAPGMPRYGFGQFGIFPAELSAKEINLDSAIVVSGR